MGTKTPLFKLGQTLQTRAISDKAAKDLNFAAFITNSLQKHHSGDWGDSTKEDQARNNEALKANTRLLSIYKYANPKKENNPTEQSEEVKIWIITEADRSVTMVIFPSEY